LEKSGMEKSDSESGLKLPCKQANDRLQYKCFWFCFMQDLSAVGQALCCNWPISFLLRIVAVCAELSGAPSPSNQPHSLQTEQEAHCRRSGSLLGRKPAPGGKMRLVCRQFWVVATRS